MKFVAMPSYLPPLPLLPEGYCHHHPMSILCTSCDFFVSTIIQKQLMLELPNFTQRSTIWALGPYIFIDIN